MTDRHPAVSVIVIRCSVFQDMYDTLTDTMLSDRYMVFSVSGHVRDAGGHEVALRGAGAVRCFRTYTTRCADRHPAK